MCLVSGMGKKKGPNRNSARFKIQYPMKNQGINARSETKLHMIIIYFDSFKHAANLNPTNHQK